METKLKATLQKSYYGKATVRTENGWTILKSYETDVAAIDPHGNFIRLWSGWSSTTAKHVNDFRIQNGFDKISKARWMGLPCINEQAVYNVYMSNGFFTHKCPALLTEEEAEKETEKEKYRAKITKIL